ncbi:PREDICTED: vasoactive intestinal polypeptide receptor 2 [Thamnophis sirtalis]|uniref:ribonuclease H n=1 Tax=Thamnophis sirtalis TaxID=35019 RepID=A0A6I9XEP1_9SAUR|nr:PREDICTED: vasoactive intestinal polypeptide receptor 2 [Thamnophis sirtalis]
MRSRDVQHCQGSHFPLAMYKLNWETHWKTQEPLCPNSISNSPQSLRTAAIQCEFINLDYSLVKQFACGVHDVHHKQRLLARANITFQQAVEEARATELSEQSMAEMQHCQQLIAPPQRTCLIDELVPLDDLEEDQDYQETHIPILGSYAVWVDYGNFHGKLPILVVGKPLPALLGLEWFLLLGLSLLGFTKPRPPAYRGGHHLSSLTSSTANPYLVPVVQHLLNSLGQDCIFAKLDMAQAYQQLLVDEEATAAQTIITHQGAFRCRCLQFSVSVAPRIFQSLMEHLLHGLPGVVPYFDDILIADYSRSGSSKSSGRTLSSAERNYSQIEKEAQAAVSGIKVSRLPVLDRLHRDHPGIARMKALARSNVWWPRMDEKITSWVSHGTSCQLLTTHGLPDIVVSNNAFQLTLAPFKIFLDGHGVRHALIAPFHPFSNVQVVQMRSTKEALAKMDPGDWTLSAAERNYSQLDKEALAALAIIKRFHKYLYYFLDIKNPNINYIVCLTIHILSPSLLRMPMLTVLPNQVLIIYFLSPPTSLLHLLFLPGIPTIFIIIWIITRVYLDNNGCWDTNDHSAPWWIIRVPILISILVNFVIFISIIRILLQKLRSPDVGGNEQSQYKRLAKSTLLLIPLFGVHYVVFAVFGVSKKYQIVFELCLGSFQGLVVAILYCFLNSEVRGELKRKWKSWCLNERLSRDYKVHRSSVFPNDSEGGPQLHRNSATQFSSQTETSVI